MLNNYTTLKSVLSCTQCFFKALILNIFQLNLKKNTTIMKNFFLVILLSVCANLVFAKEIKLSDIFQPDKPAGAGVAVSPSHLHYNVEPGGDKTMKITINNDTERSYQFKVNLFDFDMDKTGQPTFLPPGEGEYSLSKYMSIAPSFIEMNPGDKKVFSVNVAIAIDDPSSNKSAWCIIMIEEVVEKTTLTKSKKDAMAFGITATHAFGIFAYQNPPNVEAHGVEVVDFKAESALNGTKMIQLDAENKGDGTAYCRGYVELVNFKSGTSRKLAVKNFTITPGLRREFKFEIPVDMEPGIYNAIGVVDYGSSKELLTAEMQIKL